MNVFLDTNVLIDQVLARPNFSDQAANILGLGYEGKINLFTSALSIVTTIYVCKKYGYNVAKAKQALKAISAFVNVCGLSSNNVIQNLDTEWKDYEDATQYSCAIACSADCIVTRNPKDFARSAITVLSPSDFLNLDYN